MDQEPTVGPGTRMSRRRFLGGVTALVAAGGTVGIVELLASRGSTGSGLAASPVAAAAARPTTAAVTARPTATPGPSRSVQPRRIFPTMPGASVATITVDSNPAGLSGDLIFLTPGNGGPTDGPLIVDSAGEPVWVGPVTGRAVTNFRPITYRGHPALAWWEGANNGGIGSGEHVILDAAYREVHRVRAGNGRQADLHELLLTDRGTALLLADLQVSAPAAGAAASPPPWSVMDCAIQEVDLASGRVLFEWRSLDHVLPDESLAELPTKAGSLYDYFHANAIEQDRDGNLLLSARNTSTVYKIDRSTGQIIWRLGGKRSDFSFGDGATFGWQHDVRRQTDGTLTVYDNAATPGPSRGLMLHVDETARTVTLVREYRHPEGLWSSSQGDMQVLPEGSVFIGWGSVPRFTQFAPDGTLIFDAAIGATSSYRDLRASWTGRPATAPSLLLNGQPGSQVARMSFNGATEVATWHLLGGTDPAHLASLASAPRAGFETALAIPAGVLVVAARALDAGGVTLGTSAPVSVVG